MHYNPKHLGWNLREYRLQAKLSMKEVGEHMDGRTTQAVSHWEHSKAFPSVPDLLRLADLYDCTVEDLFTKPPKAKRLI